MSDPDPTAANRPDDVESDDKCDPYDLAARRAAAEQAAALMAQAETGGLRFEAYLPPGLAEWLLGRIARQDFVDPSEAVFVMLGEQQELEQHPDLRAILLRRSLEAAENDLTPAVSLETVHAEMHAMLTAPLPEPAVWPPRARWPDQTPAEPQND
jgi:antitoxin ParD1/3/4